MTIEAARRIDHALQDDWDLRMRAHDTRVAGHDEVRVDAERQLAAWLHVGNLMLEAPAELIGSFFPDLGLFRWWWSGREHSIHLAPSRLDEAFAHAQRTDLRALLTRQHQLDGEGDAAMLCRVAAYFAHATGLLRRELEDRINFHAIFAATTRPPIIPDRDVVRTLPPPPVAPRAATPSSPPPAILAAPVLNEPSRALVLPLAQIAHASIRQAFGEHARARRGIFVVNVDASREKVRFFVTLVASTTDGELAVIDTTRDILDAAATMLTEDARTGNARWRKLVVGIDCEHEDVIVTRSHVMA